MKKYERKGWDVCLNHIILRRLSFAVRQWADSRVYPYPSFEGRIGHALDIHQQQKLMFVRNKF